MISELLKELRDLNAAWKANQVQQGCSTFTINRDHANALQDIVKRYEPTGPTVIIHRWISE